MHATDPETKSARATHRGRGLTLMTLLILTVAVGIAARWERSGSAWAGSPGTDLPGDSLTAATSRGPVSLHAQLDRSSVLRGSDGEVRVELVITGAAQTQDSGVLAVPTDLVVVLDRSGSMQGQPLHAAVAAVRELLAQLDPEDRFALVTYATAPTLAIPLGSADAASREHWSSVLTHIRADGGTNLSGGLDLAHRILTRDPRSGRAPRVIVLSDGHANQGDHSIDGLRSRAGRAVAGEYVLSAVGVGQGFDETVMSAVADAGTGNFYYLANAQALAGVFHAEFAAARETVASSLEVAIAPGDGVTVVSAAGYPLDTREGRIRFRPGDLFAGQERRVWLRLHAPTTNAGEVALGDVALDFTDGGGERRHLTLDALPALACVDDPDAYYASFDGESYRRGSRSEGIGALKQKVAAELKAGRQAEAVAEIDAYVSELKDTQRLAPSAVASDDVDSVEAFRDTVAAPAASEPAAQKALGKRFLEEGRDERRVGSKRK